MLKRWLVTLRHTNNLVGVVWAPDWYLARSAAEADCREIPREQLVLAQCALLPGENEQRTFSLEKLARALNLTLGGNCVVQVDHGAGAITAVNLTFPKAKRKKSVPWPKETKKKKR